MDDWSLKGKEQGFCEDKYWIKKLHENPDVIRVNPDEFKKHMVNYYKSDDIDILRQKLIADFCEEFVYPESNMAKEIINKRFGCD